MYKALYHPQIKKDLKKIDPSIREIIKTQHIPILLLNPKLGEKLKGDLQGTNSYHFTESKQQFRIAYVTDEETNTIYIQMIAKRGNFYNLLKKRDRAQ
ncbi:hypothetical protein TI05_10750 [Achromatium sp. WMS3]|nr:hypothetical protein TI05_10750 [Achromatium sp. WMS3]